jgi:perosamine synthetase
VIPLAKPLLGEREEQLVLDTLRSGRLALGPRLASFESAFAAAHGSTHVSAVSSGTAGLHLAIRAAGIQPGDDVVTSPFSFVASANCLLYEGARPVFCDIDPVTLNITAETAGDAITEKTTGILPVHIFGYPVDMDAIELMSRDCKLWIVEDACEALGAVHADGTPVGTRGNLSVFGFYPNKQITTGEGGVVVTHSEDEWRALVSLRNQGRSYDEGGGWFHHVRVGLNYRWTDVQAAIGIAQLERLDEILALRAAAAHRYGKLLEGVEGIELPAPDDADHRRSWFVYIVKLSAGLDRARALDQLRREGVQTAEYIPCIHLQPYMRERYGFGEGLCPVAEDAARRTFALPFFTQIEPDDQERVVEVLRAAVGAA